METEINEVKEEIKEEKKINKAIVTFFSFVIIIMIGITLYSRYIATSGLKVKEYKIVNSKIKENFHGLKIVQLSDVYYGSTINQKELENVVNKINYINPDIVIFTGNLVYQNIELEKGYETIISDTLSKINAKLGKFAIKGDADINLTSWDLIISNSGFKDLNNTYDTIYKETGDYILITGLSSVLDIEKSLDEKMNSTVEYLNKLQDEEKNNLYKILVMHEPDLIDDIKLDYDLALAGHSLGGQIRLPYFGATMKFDNSRKYYDEYYKVGNTDLYISSGLGIAHTPFRLFNRPSINFYRITKK